MDVDFGSKTASVTMQPGRELTREACQQAFEGTNYSVKSFEAAPAS